MIYTAFCIAFFVLFTNEALSQGGGTDLSPTVDCNKLETSIGDACKAEDPSLWGDWKCFQEATFLKNCVTVYTYNRNEQGRWEKITGEHDRSLMKLEDRWFNRGYLTNKEWDEYDRLGGYYQDGTWKDGEWQKAGDKARDYREQAELDEEKGIKKRENLPNSDNLKVSGEATEAYGKYSNIESPNTDNSGKGDKWGWHRPHPQPYTPPLTGTNDSPNLIREHILGNHHKAGLFNHLADAENRRGNYELGLMNAERAMGLDPTDPYARLIAAQSKYGLGDYPGAADGAHEAGALDPGLADAHALEASALYAMGDYEGARDSANKALELDPLNDAARGIRSFAEQKLRDPMSASASAADLANLWKGKEMPGAGLGGGYPGSGFGFGPGEAGEFAFAKEMARLIKMGDFDKAIALADKYLKKNPNSAAAQNYKAWAQLKKGNAKGALASANKAIRLNPKKAASYYTRALAHEKLGDIDAMLEDLQLAASLNPKYAGRLAEGKAKYGSLGKEGKVVSPILAPFLRKIAGVPVWLIALILAAIAVSAFALFGRRKRQRPSKLFKSLWGTFSSPASLAAGAPASGATLQGNRYEIEKEIGRGGMGIVYIGYEPALDRKVAIKRLREEIGINSREKDRFLQEARLVASLQHPNIISIYSIFEESGQVYLVFEYVQGKTVDQILDQRRRLTLAESKKIIKPTCDALDYAHSRKVIHRDFKPSNIMLTDEGHIKVMDFGVARMAKETVSRYSRTDVVGTPAYMAPEQEMGKVRRESDIYGLGVCLYEMLTGQLPFLGPAFLHQKMDKAYPKPTEVASSLPPEINPVLEKALSPNPEERYHSGGDFWRAFEAVPETDRKVSRSHV